MGFIGCHRRGCHSDRRITTICRRWSVAGGHSPRSSRSGDSYPMPWVALGFSANAPCGTHSWFRSISNLDCRRALRNPPAGSRRRTGDSSSWPCSGASALNATAQLASRHPFVASGAKSSDGTRSAQHQFAKAVDKVGRQIVMPYEESHVNGPVE